MRQKLNAALTRAVEIDGAESSHEEAIDALRRQIKFLRQDRRANFGEEQRHSSQMGGSKKLTAFRQRGYWASCFPEGDGITLKWWEDVPSDPDKTAEQVMHDIRECFGWNVVEGR